MLLGSIFKSITSSIKSSAASSAAKSAAGDQGYGSYSKAKSSMGSAYPSKSSWQTTKDDIAMDMGLKPKDAGYYSRLPDRSRRSQEALERMMASNDKPSGPRGPTAAELEAQRKAKELAKRKAAGQKARKKFEKEKGKRVSSLRKRYKTLLKLT